MAESTFFGSFSYLNLAPFLIAFLATLLYVFFSSSGIIGTGGIVVIKVASGDGAAGSSCELLSSFSSSEDSLISSVTGGRNVSSSSYYPNRTSLSTSFLVILCLGFTPSAPNLSSYSLPTV